MRVFCFLSITAFILVTGCSKNNPSQPHQVNTASISYVSVMRTTEARFSSNEEIMSMGPLGSKFEDVDTLPTETHNVGYCSEKREISICSRSGIGPILSFNEDDWAPRRESVIAAFPVEIPNMSKCLRMYNDIGDGGGNNRIARQTHWAVFCEGAGLLSFGTFVNDSEGIPMFEKHRPFDDIFILNGKKGVFSDCHIENLNNSVTTSHLIVKCEAGKPVYAAN